MKSYFLFLFFWVSVVAFAQKENNSANEYKKRVLESTEVDFLTSYYTQDGNNAAVSGGIGTEELSDFTSTFVVSVPLNEDDVLTVDAGISAYTSASSSNINPFDDGPADPFQASSGASSGDVWSNLTLNYSHSSDDRNTIWTAKLSVSAEYDYFSLGFGGSYTKLFNEKNTELGIHASVFLDTWNAIYPIELRPFATEGSGLNDSFFSQHTITGNQNYNPSFSEFSDESRNSYSLGLSFAQILHKNVQASLALDVVQQQGLLSTPFQRIYFNDFEDAFIGDFHLADGVEQLPDSRFKFAIGGRLNWYLNEKVSFRTFYRYYFDDWGILSHTASLEVPIKISYKFTLYPSYRYYTQTAADYFYVYESALSTLDFYTSDFDLSNYNANQIGFGVSYVDIFSKAHIWKFGIKSIDVKYYRYDRNTPFNSNIVTAGIKFVMD
jgi:hypothetical protein